MRNKTGIIESLIEKRREQEEIIAKQLAEDEKQEKESHELESSLESHLELLKEEEKAIRSKDANRYNRSDVIFSERNFFLRFHRRSTRKSSKLKLRSKPKPMPKPRSKLKPNPKQKLKLKPKPKK